MERSKLAIKNGMFGLLCQVVMLVLQFLTRKVFIDCFGVELLGISSTFTSVLNTLSLAELGFNSAIVYLLYKPLAEHDDERVNAVIYVLRRVYLVMGCFIIAAGVLLIPLLGRLLKGVEVNGYIVTIFLVHVASTAVSYFLAYRRTLLYADHRSYLLRLVEVGTNVVFMSIKIGIVLLTRNYMAYILTNFVQHLTENLILHVLDRRYHPYIHRVPFDREIFSEAWGKVKDIFVGKLAGYVYKSTDSIVLSTIVGTSTVGFMVNYTTVTTALKGLATSVVAPIAPLIGNMLAGEQDEVKHERVFRMYTYIRYLIAGGLLLPMSVLLQSFIGVWIGEQYVLSRAVLLMYCADLYIHLVHSSLCDFVSARGLFKQDKKLEIMGAAANLTISVALAFRLQIEGVLIGTVLSQMIFWIGRCVIVYRSCFGSCEGAFRRYWIRQLLYAGVFAGLQVLLFELYSRIRIDFFPLRFVCGGILCEVCFALAVLLLFRRTEEHGEVLRLVRKAIGRKKG